METRAERLAQARKKLRDYQSKHRGPNREDTSSPSPSVSSLVENSGRHSAASVQLYNHDEKKSAFERVRALSQGSPSTAQSTANHNSSDTGITAVSNHLSSKFQQNGTAELRLNGRDDTLEQECIRLKEELAVRTGEKEQLSSQLADLVEHYSRIHSAYTKLNECVKNGDSGGSALQTQLSHLQTAMSVVVKEKTALQQQLREMNEFSGDQSKQIRNLTINLNDKISHVMSLEREVTSLRKEIDSLRDALRKQFEESESDRKEAINWQSKVLRVQQDRNDAQERLKICMKETEAAQAELEEARKQLRMKDIYLRQLGAYTGATAPEENDARNFNDEIERLKNDCAQAVSEAERWKKEAQIAREHYESYGTQLNQNIMQMSIKLEEVSNEKLLLESKVQSLEGQIEMLQTLDRKKNSLNDNSGLAASHAELRKAQEELAEMMDGFQKTKHLNDTLRAELANKEKEVLELSSALKEMESELTTKNNELTKAEEALSRARSLADEQQKHAEGALSLSEQLQNEKATVSRAIAQNRELKEQLIELQDKLVVVTQESMERESGRLSALHLISQLRNQLQQNNTAQSSVGHDVASSTEIIPNGDVFDRTPYADSRDHDETVSTPSISECDDHDTSLSHAENARAHAEVELASAKMALDDLRLEHRRVTQENEELRRIMEQNSEDENQNNIHVELGQAVQRINTLSAENERLRNDIGVLQEKLQNPSLSSSPSQPDSVPPMHLNGAAADQLQAPPIAEKPLAWTELEARFARAMRQIADLIEEKEGLQHIITQLEYENDTIGDYVTYYQHQRKKINERMREREEAVAKLSFEKEQMQQKLNELQQTLVHLLAKRGLLHVYEHEKEMSESDVSPSEIRSYSHNSAKRLSGNGMAVVNGSKLLVPDSPDSGTDIVHEYGSADDEAATPGRTNKEIALGDKEHDLDADDDVGVQRILNLISELQDLERTRTLPPCSPNLHCSECRGKLINL